MSAVASKPAAEPSEGPIDETIGTYRLCFEIAAGGMAKVFLAVKDGPSGFTKVLAIKRIHSHLADDEGFVEMFLDEARIASQINHPNVCAIVDYGESPSGHFLAMEYLVGESLRHVHKALAGAPSRSAVMAARIIAETCEGLHAAHELRDASGAPLNVVHRDVSPQNVFVTYDGAVKVMDFGIATARDRVHHTETGTVKGKFAYMSPEQVRGESVDRRADVWALGVLLWETVALRRLFGRRNDSETILAVMNDAVVPLAEIVSPDLGELDRIVRKALERDLSRRYASARDLGRDLARWIASRGEAAGAVEVAEWMTTLFPDGLGRKQQLMRLAQTDRSIPQVYSDSGTKSLGTLASMIRGRSQEATTRGRAKKKRERRLVGIGVAAIAALVAVIGVTALALGGPDAPVATAPASGAHSLPPPPPVTAPPAPTEVLAEATVARSPEAPIALDAPSREVVAAPEVDARAETVPLPPVPATGAPVRARVARVTGFADVATPGGWATVYEGRRRLGVTPGRFSLATGHHSLRLVPFDDETRARTVVVDVREGEPTRVRADLRH